MFKHIGIHIFVLGCPVSYHLAQMLNLNGRLGWANPGFAYENGVVREMVSGESSFSGILAFNQVVGKAGWLNSWNKDGREPGKTTVHKHPGSFLETKEQRIDPESEAVQCMA